MERACDEIPRLNATKLDTHTDNDNPTNEVTETNASGNQYGDSDGEVHLPQDTTSGEQSTSERQYNVGPAEPVNRKLHHEHRNHGHILIHS